jgi:hypothetical protein
MCSMAPGTPDADLDAPEVRVFRTQPAPRRASLDGRPRRAPRTPRVPQPAGRPALHLARAGAPLLVAGADAARRGVLLRELADTMPDGTLFAQAGTLAEILEQAPQARMVILSGDLDDASPRSLMRVLGRRHPNLPIVALVT